jgi:hypothetical protein
MLVLTGIRRSSAHPVAIAFETLLKGGDMKRLLFGSVTGCCVILCFFLTVTLAADPPRISKEDLQAMLGNTDLVIIDDRSGADWSASEFKIKGAVREDPGKAETWMEKYSKDKPLVFY